jgi:hypothetical protein
MEAELLSDERYAIGDTAFAEIVIWRVSRPLAGSSHAFKYRLAFVVNGRCVLRYDNEKGKGDHRHIRGREHAYRFANYERLLADFWTDVDKWWRDHENRND